MSSLMVLSSFLTSTSSGGRNDPGSDGGEAARASRRRSPMGRAGSGAGRPRRAAPARDPDWTHSPGERRRQVWSRCDSGFSCLVTYSVLESTGFRELAHHALLLLGELLGNHDLDFHDQVPLLV